MGKYITNFETTAAYNAAEANLAKPHVSLTKDNMGVHFLPVRNNIIMYQTLLSSPLSETTDTSKGGLHTNAFNTTIKSHTYNNQTKTGTIEFNDDVTTIGDFAFYRCDMMLSIEIPSTVTSIGNNAFASMSQNPGYLSDVRFANGSRLTSIGQMAFSWCYHLTSINIPDSVTSIGNLAFEWCGSLTSIVIPSGVTSINMGAFSNCRSLTSVTIPNGTIGIGAFENCSGLTSVTIGSGVTSIGNNAFTDCTSLATITSNIMSAPSVQPGTFYGVAENGTLYVPVGSSGYETWMSNQGNLGMYNWTKV